MKYWSDYVKDLEHEELYEFLEGHGIERGQYMTPELYLRGNNELAELLVDACIMPPADVLEAMVTKDEKAHASNNSSANSLLHMRYDSGKKSNDQVSTFFIYIIYIKSLCCFDDLFFFLTIIRARRCVRFRC